MGVDCKAKKIKKVAKSGYKFIFTSYNDLLIYFKKLIPLKKIKLRRMNFRSCTVNKWNINFRYYIHQGKYKRLAVITNFHIGYKLGMLVQTRKPFFFRSKKKKR